MRELTVTELDAVAGGGHGVTIGPNIIAVPILSPGSFDGNGNRGNGNGNGDGSLLSATIVTVQSNSSH